MRPAPFALVDLRELRGSDLAPVLDAQAVHWRTRFAWDCRSAMRSVRSLLDRRALSGRALIVESRPRGYCYFFMQGRTAIVGDLYVRERESSRKAEALLLESTVNDAALRGGVERIEGQLLCLKELPSLSPALRGSLLEFPRLLMLNRDPGGRPPDRRSRPAPRDMRLMPWSDGFLEPGARLLVRTYGGHVDSQINELYSSIPGARRLLANATFRAGSGVFFPPAGMVALGVGAAPLSGMCLGSLVADDVGHVLQVCVDPRARGRGVGSELLRRALAAFAQAGCSAVSLTVTGDNLRALRLYRRYGFRTIASFPAFVWRRR